MIWTEEEDEQRDLGDKRGQESMTNACGMSVRLRHSDTIFFYSGYMLIMETGACDIRKGTHWEATGKLSGKGNRETSQPDFRKNKNLESRKHNRQEAPRPVDE